MAITIRSGGSQASQQKFKVSIEALLSQIRMAKTGRILLRRLYDASYDVIIEPNLDPGGFNNAYESAASHVHAGNAVLNKAARGTRSIVEFSPNRLSRRQNLGAPHEVLFHELAHSLRTVTGRTRYDSSGNLKKMSGDYGNVEEFFAIMLTNVYSSELKRPVFGNHGMWKLKSMDQLRKPPFDRRLRDFAVSMPDLCRELAAIPAKEVAFNPFRDIAMAK